MCFSSVYILTETWLREVAVLLEQALQPLLFSARVCWWGLLLAVSRAGGMAQLKPRQPLSVLVGKKLGPILLPKACP